MHCQNADWAIPFLLHKFNITAQDSLIGTDFGKYVKYKRPERRGGKPFLSGKSWKTTYVYSYDSPSWDWVTRHVSGTREPFSSLD